jgi:hypothetical protein
LSPVQVSILIPVYNEEDLVSAAIECVLTLPLWASVPVELIAVDDGSTGGSGEALDRIARERPCLRVVHHPRNRGKNIVDGRTRVRVAISPSTRPTPPEVRFWEVCRTTPDKTRLFRPPGFLPAFWAFRAQQCTKPVLPATVPKSGHGHFLLPAKDFL